MINAIENYIIRRVQDNAKLYEQKQLLDAPFALSDVQRSLFLLLHTALLEHLSLGHTLLAIGDDDGYKFIPQMRAWQAACLNFGLTTLQASAQHADMPALFTRYHDALDQFIQKQISAQDLQILISKEENYYKEKLTNQNQLVDQQTQENLLALFTNVMRAYYVMRVTAKDSLENFVQILQRHPFFYQLTNQQNQRQYQHNMPMIFAYERQTLYLWTHRSHHAEVQLLAHIERIAHGKVALFATDKLADNLNTEQKQAVLLAAKSAFTMITGGPGTGKTHTVAQIVGALMANAKHPPRLALAAPTGKAAQRMSESLQKNLEKNQASNAITLPKPKTIHRLLGLGASSTPRYHAANPLPFDIIIIDEASMLGVELAEQLLAAVRTGARLILLGDAHQLAAVDSGAVLADLCRIDTLQPYQVQLVESRRFHEDSGVGKLAKLINQRDFTDKHTLFDQFTALIAAEKALGFNNIRTQNAPIDKQKLYANLVKNYQNYFLKTKECYGIFAKFDAQKQQQIVKELLEKLNEYRILCASHQGICGDEAINAYISAEHRQNLGVQIQKSPWYHGRVVMIVKNSYDLGLYNGDIGICLDTAQGFTVFFEGEKLRKVAASALDSSIATAAYAMTVHKSQGSEWATVAVVFDETHRQLLSKELFYTAVTRAKDRVQIYSTDEAVITALTTPTVRQTGLLFQSQHLDGKTK